MVNQDDGLLREVEEELRRERLANLWNQYGIYVVAAALLIVGSVAGTKIWQNQQIEAAQSAGAAYQSAMQSLANGKAEDAIKAFQDVRSGGQDGYQTLAALQLAGAQLEKGQTGEAKAAYDKVAADSSADPLLRDFAVLQSVALDIGNTDFTAVQNRLTPLMKPTSPWQGNARELVALSAFHAKKYDVAQEHLRAIVSDPKSAAGLIQRANTLLASIAAIEVRSKSAAVDNEKQARAGGAAEVTGAKSESGTAQGEPDAAIPASNGSTDSPSDDTAAEPAGTKKD